MLTQFGVSYLDGSHLLWQNICFFHWSTHGEGFKINPLENKAKHKLTGKKGHSKKTFFLKLFHFFLLKILKTLKKKTTKKKQKPKTILTMLAAEVKASLHSFLSLHFPWKMWLKQNILPSLLLLSVVVSVFQRLSGNPAWFMLFICFNGWWQIWY